MEQTLSLLRPEDVTAAGDLLERADKVLCMGQGGSMVMAQEAAHLFSTAFGKYFAVTDSHIGAELGRALASFCPESLQGPFPPR